MRLSYNALNRMVEQHAPALRTEVKPAPASARNVLSKARRLSDDELLKQLRSLGVELDRDRLSALVKIHCSAQAIAEELLRGWRPRPGQPEIEADWAWLAVAVFWERWFPEQPNFERVDDAMQRGYEQKEDRARCDVWLEVWTDLLKLREKAGCRSLGELEDRFGGTQSIFNWIQDFEMALGNAALDQPRYHEARVRVCEEFLPLLHPQEELLTPNIRRGLAESAQAMDDKGRGDALYRAWLEEDPRWGWGWIGWADLYFFGCRTVNRDLVRAEAILKQGLSIEHVRDREDILERLAGVYEDQGRSKEAAETHALLASAQSARSRAGQITRLADKPDLAGPPADALPPHLIPRKVKIGRNEPCPCGSGKKFKHCCGR